MTTRLPDPQLVVDVEVEAIAAGVVCGEVTVKAAAGKT